MQWSHIKLPKVIVHVLFRMSPALRAHIRSVTCKDLRKNVAPERSFRLTPMIYGRHANAKSICDTRYSWAREIWIHDTECDTREVMNRFYPMGNRLSFLHTAKADDTRCLLVPSRVSDLSFRANNTNENHIWAPCLWMIWMTEQVRNQRFKHKTENQSQCSQVSNLHLNLFNFLLDKINFEHCKLLLSECPSTEILRYWSDFRAYSKIAQNGRLFHNDDWDALQTDFGHDVTCGEIQPPWQSRKVDRSASICAQISYT
jgi:hypothetical protein